MISSFGKFAKGIGSKIILSVLGLSMIVFWGLGGLTNLSLSSNKPAIEIGEDSISMEQLARAFDRERERMGMMMGGKYISPEEGVRAGLLSSAVQGQIINSVSNQVRHNLGLTASDDAVRKYVERNPAFADALGNFDKNIFYAYLAQTRMNETELAYKLRQELALQHLNNTIIELGYNPQSIAHLLYKYKNEKRTVDGVLIDPTRIKITAKPSEEELQEYYEAYAKDFILPEYRTVSIIHITPQNVSDKIVMDTDALETLYQERKATFGTPEKRELLQMLFDTKEKAEKATNGLTAQNFADVAKKQANQTDKQTLFGWVTQNDMIAELSEPVFKGKKNTIVGPIQTSLGWHLVLVKDIQAAKQLSETEIKKQIKEQYIADHSYDAVQDLVRKLEDSLGAGNSFKTTANTLKLPIKKVGTFDITGATKDGSSIDAELKNTTFLQDIFTLTQNEPSAVIEIGTGYVVALVESIIPSAPQEFKDAKEKLTQLWVQEQQKGALKETAETVVALAKKGTSLKTQNAFKDFEMFSETDITREHAGKLIPDVIPTVFAQQKGAEHTTATTVFEGIFVSTVHQIKTADPTTDEFGVNVVKQNLKNQIGEGLANEIMGAYTQELGAQVNENDIMKAFSLSPAQE